MARAPSWLLLALLVACVTPAKAPPALLAQDSPGHPPAQAPIDPASAPDRTFGSDAPHTKGEHFVGVRFNDSFQVYATLDVSGNLEPEWNLRAPTNWRPNELVLISGGEGGAHWTRLLSSALRRWPGMHRSPTAEWDMPHSPFRLGGMLGWMRFRRVDLGRDGRYDLPDDIFTLVETFGGGELCRLPNLADSPRLSPDGARVLFRVFPEADAKSEYRLLDFSADGGALREPEGRAPLRYAEYPILSRAVWLGPRALCFIRAKELPNNVAYRGELVLVTFDDAGVASPPAIMLSGDFPVETALDPLLWDAASGRLGVLLNAAASPSDNGAKPEKGATPGKRRALVFDFGQTFAATETPQAPKPPTIPKPAELGLASALILMDDNLVLARGATTFIVEAADAKSDGEAAPPSMTASAALPFAPAGVKRIDDGMLLLLKAPVGAETRGQGYAICAWSGDAWKTLADSDGAAKALPAGDWVAANVKSVKDMAPLLKDGKLKNTVLAFDFDIKVNQERYKNAKGTILELYQRAPNEMIRVEDNIEGEDWAIKTWNGGEAFIATDAAAAFRRSRGDVAEVLAAQMRARRLLLIENPLSEDRDALIGIGIERLTHPDSREVRETAHFRRAVGGVADYWFDREGKEHDLLCARLTFPVGGDKDQMIELWFSGYGELHDLSPRGTGPALRAPFRIEAYTPGSGELRFTATLRKEVTRKTFRGGRDPILSGYNWSALDGADFGAGGKEPNYDMDD